MKVKIIETGEIKTVLRSVAVIMIEQGHAVDAEHENDPEADAIRAHLGAEAEKSAKKEVIEVVHRHVIEEEE